MLGELLSSVADALESLEAERLTSHWLEDAVFQDLGAAPFPKFHAA